MEVISNDRKYFTFVLMVDGEEHEYSIPLLSSLPASYVRDIAAISRIPDSEKGEALLAIQFDILDKYAPGVVDIATSADIKEIVQLWQDAGQEDISLGE